MLRATKVHIYPTPEQAEFLTAQFGAVRFAYNKALHIKTHAYRLHGINLSPKKDLKPLLAVAKKSRKYHLNPRPKGRGYKRSNKFFLRTYIEGDCYEN